MGILWVVYLTQKGPTLKRVSGSSTQITSGSVSGKTE